MQHHAHHWSGKAFRCQCDAIPPTSLRLTRMCTLKNDADKVNQVEASQVEYTPAPSPPPGKLTLEYIKHVYPPLFEGLGELGPPFSFSLNSEV